MIGPEALQTLKEGADYSSLIAAVTHAYIAGDTDELHRLLDAVDPIEARLTANKLRVVYAFHSPDPADGSEWPATAPNVYPMVTHAGDNWSRKAPCR